MEGFGALARRALDRGRRLTASLAPTGRRALTVAVAAGLLVSVLGPPIPARADTPPDPAARLQLFIQVVHVNDDHDWFGGNDFGWDATLRAIDGPPAGLSTGECCIHVSTGEEATLNRPVPRSDHEVSGGATLAAGMPVYAGHQ